MTAKEIDILIFNTAAYEFATNGRPDLGGSEDFLRLIVAQARHETGNYTSKFFKQNNNCFGYSYVPGSAYQNGHGSVADNSQFIGSYATIEDSVKELVHWWFRKNRGLSLNEKMTANEYASALKLYGYYGDTASNYSSALIRHLKEIDFSVSVFAFPLLVIIVLAFKVFFV